MDRAEALAVVDRALSKFPELRRVRCGSPVHVSWVQTTTMDLSWRARRPGDRQCARSSNLSRRWRLRQQCRHSTLGSAGSRVKPSTKLDQAQKVLRASADCATALLDLPLAPAPIDYQSPMDFKRSRDKAE